MLWINGQKCKTTQNDCTRFNLYHHRFIQSFVLCCLTLLTVDSMHWSQYIYMCLTSFWITNMRYYSTGVSTLPLSSTSLRLGCSLLPVVWLRRESVEVWVSKKKRWSFLCWVTQCTVYTFYNHVNGTELWDVWWQRRPRAKRPHPLAVNYSHAPQPMAH